jgi:hypothetical protein
MSSAVDPDLASLAKTALVALQAAVDTILGAAETDLTPLTGDALTAALAAVESFIPAPFKAVVSALISTANAAAHSAVVSAVDTPGLAALAIAKARIDATLQVLEATV